MNPPLPDALAKALGRVAADLHKEWQKDVQRLEAESRAVIAELRAEIVGLKAELKEAAEGVERRVAEALAKVKDGRDGEPGPQGPQGPQGERGEKGDSGLQGEAGAPGEKGEAGEKGDTGPQGASGRDGADAAPITPEMVAEAVLGQRDAIVEAVRAYLAEHPPAQGAPGQQGPAGEKGEPGERGDPGERGRDGEAGPAGRDGIGAAKAFIDRDGQLILTFTDGSTHALGHVVGKDGAPGRDGADGKAGRDGFGLEDMRADLDEDGRTIVVSGIRGDERKELGRCVLPIMLDRGVYKSGEQYRKGDAVTFAGSLFVAQADTAEKPETGSGWRLAVKRGRDGKDGKDGERGPPGKDGKDAPRRLE